MTSETRREDLELSIEEATEADIEVISKLAQSLQLLDEKSPPESGFLISDYTLEDYRYFFKRGRKDKGSVHILVARAPKGVCAGFLLAYSEDYVRAHRRGARKWKKGGTEDAIWQLLAPLDRLLLMKSATKFHVIKQVGVAKDLQGKAVGSRLYSHFLNSIDADYVFSAIVAEIPNPSSEKLHRSFGFFPIMQCRSFSINLENAGRPPYVNHVWLRPSLPSMYQYDKNAELPSLAKTDTGLPSLVKEGSVNDIVFRNLEHVAHLYRHEDNLNWNKLRAMTTGLVGFMAIVGFLMHDKFSDPQVFQPNMLVYMSFLTVVFGSLILFAFVASIQSGLFFMHSHKQVMRIIEAYIRLLSAKEKVPFISPIMRVPAQSRTVRFLKMSYLYVFFLWLITCALLVFTEWSDILSIVRGRPE